MSQSTQLADVIEYIASSYSDSDLTRTKLVKFTFLADHEADSKLGSKITDTKYIKYHYGPYSDDIIEAIESLDGERIQEEKGITRKGAGECYLYNHIGDDPDVDLTEAQETIIENVIEEWGDYDTESLLDELYEKYNIDDYPKYSTIL